MVVMTMPQPEKNSRKIEPFLSLYTLRLIWDKTPCSGVFRGQRGKRGVC